MKAGQKIIKEDERMDDTSSGMEIQAQPSGKPQEAEKLFTRDELAQIVAAQRKNAAREVEERLRKDQETQAIQAGQQQRNAEVPRDIDANAIYQQVQERFNEDMRKRQEEQHLENLKAEFQRAANSYNTKIASGKSQYSDFDEITKDFDPAAFPQLIYLVSGMDNAADIIYELSKNPLKLTGLDRLAEKNPRQAQSELAKLAQSISVNKQAQSDAESQVTDAPLDRLQPSIVSGSNGKQSIRDLRAQPHLRG